jgi:hypothetical protein
MTSLGAGGSLIAAALCAAAFVGGLLAVGDAVDGAAEARDGDVTVPAAGVAPDPATAEPDLPTAAAAAAAATAAERRAPARRAPERSLRPRNETTAPAPPVRTPSVGRDTTSTGEDAGGGSGSSDPKPPPAEGRPAGPVRRTVDQARETVAPVVDAAPEPVQPVVDEVVTVVEEVVAPVTDLLPPLGGR